VHILWVRHAAPQRIESGTGVPANPPLTAAGKQQADRLADWLARERIDVILSSPQARAQETAAPIAAAHGRTVEIVDGLVEYDVQADHYIPVEELRAANNDRWRAMVEGRWDLFGGEDPEVFRARVRRAVDVMVAAHAGETVVAVCHGGVINVALAEVLGLEQPLWFDPGYTSISRMAASRTGVRSVMTLNECAHLYAVREDA
jgi:2,3-bisphosphoglycerate-dependent phosphoglycerate mutase